MTLIRYVSITVFSDAASYLAPGYFINTSLFTLKKLVRVHLAYRQLLLLVLYAPDA